MKYIAALALLFLILGLPTIHFQHHLNLPQRDKYEVLSETYLGLTGFYKVYDIRLNDEIGGENTVKGITTALMQAESGDVINFHLAGYGGQVETVLYLINNIHATKGTVNMIVESNVYSGHAYLALQGKTLTMLPHTFLMFHTSSAYGENCNKEKGLDRGVSKKLKCEQFLKIHLRQTNEVIAAMPILTDKEKFDIMTGQDVYITAQDVSERANK